MKRICLIFAGLVLTAAFLVAQLAGGTVKGQVFHKDGMTPYGGCVILLENVDSRTSDIIYRSDPTDDSGNYTLGNVPPGIYKVKLLRPQTRKARKTLTIVHVVSGQIVEHSIFDRARTGSMGFLKSPFTYVALLLTGVYFFL